MTSELDIEKEVVAFLNYKEDGYIYIGIDKDGSTVGVNDVDDFMLRLKDRIKHNISPSAMGLFDIAEEQKDGQVDNYFKFTDNFIRITLPISAHEGSVS